MKKLLSVLVLLGCTQISFAQQRTHNQTLYWLRYQNQLVFSQNLYWINDFDNRRFFRKDVENQFIIHSRLHYRIGQWDFGGGLTSSWAFAAFPEAGYQNSLHELRPVIEASYEHLAGKVFLQGRVRTDYRFFQSDTETSVFNESDFTMRFRFRFQARLPLKVNEENIPLISVRFADEIMFNHEKNTYDQNRIYITGEYYINENFSLETGYLYIHQQRFAREEFFERHVARFSILHRMYIRKKVSSGKS